MLFDTTTAVSEKSDIAVDVDTDVDVGIFLGLEI